MTQTVLDRQQALTTEPVRRSPLVAPAASRRGLAVAAMAVGLVVVAAAVVILLTLQSSASSHKPAPAPVAPGVADAGFPNVVASESHYVPGHSSGWHLHPGVHSIVVLSGTLTVYDHDCVRHEYGVGQSYVGGRQPHLARNEGSEAVELVATYVAAPSAPDHGSSVAPPPGCRAL